MQAQVQYKSEIRTITNGNRTITIENLIPILSPKERERCRREVEKRLFDVLVKYEDKNRQVAEIK